MCSPLNVPTDQVLNYMTFEELAVAMIHCCEEVHREHVCELSDPSSFGDPLTIKVKFSNVLKSPEFQFNLQAGRIGLNETHLIEDRKQSALNKLLICLRRKRLRFKFRYGHY